MQDINFDVKTGNLTKDPVVREVAGKNKTVKVATFTLAVGRSYENAEGVKKDETQFITCEAWDSGAEMMEKYLKKGDRVLVIGSWKVDEWKDKETDEFKRRDKLRVDRFEKLYSANGNKNVQAETNSGEEKEQTVSSSPEAGNGNDIPF